MLRLTKKNEQGGYYSDYCGPEKQPEIQKLGELEDLEEEFGIQHVTRNDILRYKLYNELKLNGYKTLYSNTYIPREEIFSKRFDIEHIIPQSRLFDDSFSNKTLEVRDINIEKGNKTAKNSLNCCLSEKIDPKKATKYPKTPKIVAFQKRLIRKRQQNCQKLP